MSNLTPDVNDVVVQARGEVSAAERELREGQDCPRPRRGAGTGVVRPGRSDCARRSGPGVSGLAKAELDVNGKLVPRACSRLRRCSRRSICSKVGCASGWNDSLTMQKRSTSDSAAATTSGGTVTRPRPSGVFPAPGRRS